MVFCKFWSFLKFLKLFKNLCIVWLFISIIHLTALPICTFLNEKNLHYFEYVVNIVEFIQLFVKEGIINENSPWNSWNEIINKFYKKYMPFYKIGKVMIFYARKIHQVFVQFL